jgi:anti-sigma B factor antagonist/stage II sporulation protein AA (anti-sigma F factor antagonist)
MNIQSERRGKVMVVSATGRIDFSGAEAFRAAITPHLDECVNLGSALLLDLGGVDYISSAGLRELLIAAKRIAGTRGRMMVCRLQPMVKEVVRISRFDLVLSITEEPDEALARLESAP